MAVFTQHATLVAVLLTFGSTALLCKANSLYGGASQVPQVSSSYGAAPASPSSSSYGSPSSSSYQQQPQVPQLADTVVLGMSTGAANIPIPDNYVPLFRLYNPVVPRSPKVIFDNPWVDFDAGEPADVPEIADHYFDFEVDEPFLGETNSLLVTPILQGQTRYFYLDNNSIRGPSAAVAANTAATASALASASGSGSGSGYRSGAGSGSGYGAGASSATSSGGTYGRAGTTVVKQTGTPTGVAADGSLIHPAKLPGRASSASSDSVESIPAERQTSFNVIETASSAEAPAAFTSSVIPSGRQIQRPQTFFTPQQRPSQAATQDQQQFRFQRQLFPVQQQQQQQQQQQNIFPQQSNQQPFVHETTPKLKFSPLSSQILPPAQQTQPILRRPDLNRQAQQIFIQQQQPLQIETTTTTQKSFTHPVFQSKFLALPQQTRQQFVNNGDPQLQSILVQPLSNTEQKQMESTVAQLQSVEMNPSVQKAQFFAGNNRLDFNAPVVHPLLRNGPKVDKLMTQARPSQKLEPVLVAVTVREEVRQNEQQPLVSDTSTTTVVTESPAAVSLATAAPFSESINRFFSQEGVQIHTVSNGSLVEQTPTIVKEAIRLHPALRNKTFSLLEQESFAPLPFPSSATSQEAPAGAVNGAAATSSNALIQADLQALSREVTKNAALLTKEEEELIRQKIAEAQSTSPTTILPQSPASAVSVVIPLQSRTQSVSVQINQPKKTV